MSLEAAAASMWVEKYRPAKISEIVNQSEIVGSLGALLENPAEMPHLLFSGSAGVGKTTTAICIARQVLGQHYRDNVLELNASDERGIGMVREKIKRYSKFAGISEVPFKIIILDEADEMTSDAQTALRRIIEDASRTCRFIMIANNISKIIDPIQSRFATFKFTSISRDDVTARLAAIAKKEGVKVGKAGLDAIYDYSEGDMRHAINLMQAAAASAQSEKGGAITADSVRAAAGLSKVSDVDKVIAGAISGDIAGAREKMIELVRVYGMSESDFLKYASASLFRSGGGGNGQSLGTMLQIVAKYDYQILSGANSEIQLSAMLAELAAAATTAAATS